MNIFIYLALLFQFCLLLVNGQRVPPGVPPQHYKQPEYQQQVPQQQYAPQHQQQVQYQQQQVPAHQQQVPVHQQQVPVNQQQVPQQHIPQQQVPQQQVPQQQVPQQQVPQQQVPQQQVPVQQQQQGRPKHQHDRPKELLNAANAAGEAQHIQEHMEVPMDTSKMTDTELQFHYFKMHDADNNNKLDGCELIKSLIHWHEQGSKDGSAKVEEKVFKDEELVNLIDPILNVDDYNQDGYIDYPEFIRAQQKAAGQAKPQA